MADGRMVCQVVKDVGTGRASPGHSNKRVLEVFMNQERRRRFFYMKLQTNVNKTILRDSGPELDNLIILRVKPASMSEHNMSIYTTLVALSLSLGFWIGTRVRNPTRTHLVNLRRSRTEPLAAVRPAALLQSRASTVNDNSTSLRVNAIQTDSCKMVLVVRTDLGMTSGKIAAQCSHATLACYKFLQAKDPALLRQWERTGQTKVALRCEHEEELLLLEAQAQSLNLCARSIEDAGRTQIAAGSRTVLGIIGPTRLINQITGELRLL